MAQLARESSQNLDKSIQIYSTSRERQQEQSLNGSQINIGSVSSKGDINQYDGVDM